MDVAQQVDRQWMQFHAALANRPRLVHTWKSAPAAFKIRFVADLAPGAVCISVASETLHGDRFQSSVTEFGCYNLSLSLTMTFVLSLKTEEPRAPGLRTTKLLAKETPSCG